MRRAPELSSDGDLARASRFIARPAHQVQQAAVLLVVVQPRDLGGRKVEMRVDGPPRLCSATSAHAMRWSNGPLAITLSTEEIRQQVEASEVLVLTRRVSAPPPIYPYDQSLEAARPELETLATKHFELMTGGQFAGREVLGYVRRSVDAFEDEQHAEGSEWMQDAR